MHRTPFLAAAFAAVVSTGALGQTTAFSYQGRLTDNGAQANGTAAIRATLWDAASLGNQVGVIDEDTAVIITNGLFNTELDFGPGAFDGSPRYLQIEVMLPYDPQGAYSVLPMRTKVLAVPMAQYAEFAATTPHWTTSNGNIVDALSGNIQIDPLGRLGVGTTPANSFALDVLGQIDGIRVDTPNGDGIEATSLLGTAIRASGDIGIEATSTRQGGTALVANATQSQSIGILALAQFPESYAGEFIGRSLFTGSVGINREPFINADLTVSNPTPGDRIGLLAEGYNTGVRSEKSLFPVIAITSLDQNARAVQATTGADNAIAVYGLNFGTGHAAYFVGTNYFSDDTGIGDETPDARLDVVESSGSAPVSIMERTSLGGIGSDVLRLIVPSGTFPAAQFLETRLASDVKHRLEASGDVYADGSFFPGGADFAELVPVAEGAETVEPGDVMILDVNSEGQFAKSLSPRSTLVAGIYSTKPGVLASQHDWDKLETEHGSTNPDGSPASPYDIAARLDEVPLAVVGIVPCKVSAENGPIRTGDLLVTASIPGHAMRDDDPRNGTIVGKAMGSLDRGTGVIKVLVTLQ